MRIESLLKYSKHVTALQRDISLKNPFRRLSFTINPAAKGVKAKGCDAGRLYLVVSLRNVNARWARCAER